MDGSQLPSQVRRRTVLKGAGAAAVAGGAGLAIANAPTADAAVPPALQAALQRLVNWRFGLFMHFNMATFTDEEWATGGLDVNRFNPTQLNCTQWATAAKSAGMQYAVLTTKHHDGFCIWPTRQNEYSVRNSTVFRRDVVREYVDAFRAAEITPCFYYSIWDKTHGVDRGSITRADIDYTKAQFTELLGGTYGEIPLLVIDGWAWRMGHHQMPYDEIRAHIKSLNPNIIICDLNGMTDPWQTDAIFFEEPKGIWAPEGNIFAGVQSTNITNTGWFWHPPNSTNGRGDTAAAVPRSWENIVNDHIKTLEARYVSFLLNCPPNNKGLLDTNIVNRLKEVGPKWQPNTGRAPLPPQPDILLYPVTPIRASATSGNAANAIDGTVDWAQFARESRWESTGSLPQSVTMDLGAVYSNIDTVSYLPRQDRPTVTGAFITTGNITGYRVLTSTNGTTFTEAARGTWAGNKFMKLARFAPRNARYVRLEATATVGGGPAILSELDCGGIAAPPRAGGITPSTGPTTPVPTTPPPTTPPPTGTFKLINRRSGKALTIAADGQTLVQMTDTGAANQRFQVVQLEGFAKLVNPATARAVDVFARSLLDRAAVVVWTDNGGLNQQWAITELAGGYRKLINRNSGKALEVGDRSLLDNAPVIQWTDNGGNNQQWSFVAV
ncbi:MAG TPA: alpha-L-fucosidase [Micromonosporaceae bacterium]|nr:alpha-L-fucosidase [Micromonosporaceae bacterium]